MRESLKTPYFLISKDALYGGLQKYRSARHHTWSNCIIGYFYKMNALFWEEYEVDWLNEIEEGNYQVGIRTNSDFELKCLVQTQCEENGEGFGFFAENGKIKNNEVKIIWERYYNKIIFHMIAFSRNYILWQSGGTA